MTRHMNEAGASAALRLPQGTEVWFFSFLDSHGNRFIIPQLRIIHHPLGGSLLQQELAAVALGQAVLSEVNAELEEEAFKVFVGEDGLLGYAGIECEVRRANGTKFPFPIHIVGGPAWERAKAGEDPTGWEILIGGPSGGPSGQGLH